MLGDFTFETPPLIEASGSGHARRAARRRSTSSARSRSTAFTYRTVAFDGLTADFAWDQQRLMLRDLHLRHRSGQLNADLFDAPNDFRLNCESSISPDRARAARVAGSRAVSRSLGMATLTESSA